MGSTSAEVMKATKEEVQAAGGTRLQVEGGSRGYLLSFTIQGRPGRIPVCRTPDGRTRLQHVRATVRKQLRKIIDG